MGRKKETKLLRMHGGKGETGDGWFGWGVGVSTEQRARKRRKGGRTRERQRQRNAAQRNAMQRTSEWGKLWQNSY
jgi:hypothetical protein